MRKAILDTNIILRLLIKDDETKRRACESLIQNSLKKGLELIILPITMLEIVWVMEKIYGLSKTQIREIVEAVLNTPELHVEMGPAFRLAIKSYEEKNIKFADAVIGHWALERDIADIYTYDEKDFKKIEGLKVLRP